MKRFPSGGGLYGCLLLATASLAADDPRLNQLVIHSLNGSYVGRTQITGNVGSNQYTEIASGAWVNGDVQSTQALFLAANSRVMGDATASAITQQSTNPPVVNGALKQGVSVPAIPIENLSVTTGTTAVNVPQATSRILAPGSYGAVTAGNSSTLLLSSGTYNLSSLVLGVNATLSINVIEGGLVRINIKGDVDIGDRSIVAVYGGDASQVRFHTTSTRTTNAFRIGTDVNFKGVVSAPVGEIHVYSRTALSGALWGKTVRIEPEVGMIKLDGPVAPGTGTISGSVVNGFLGTIQARFTADNHYAHYFGRSDGSSLRLAGRNEKGAWGGLNGVDPVTQDPSNLWNWSQAEDYNYTVGPDDHLYIVAWDCGGGKMWAGQFMMNGDVTRRYSDKDNWEYINARGPNLHKGDVSSGFDAQPDGDLPSVDELWGEISQANWKPVGWEAPNDGLTWPVIPNLDPQAMLVWSTDGRVHSSMADEGFQHYQIFRSKTPMIKRHPLGSWKVYIDQNGNGALDPGEPAMVTDFDGRYSFTNLAPGSYLVRVVAQSGWTLVRSPDLFSLSAGQNAVNQDFVVKYN